MLEKDKSEEEKSEKMNKSDIAVNTVNKSDITVNKTGIAGNNSDIAVNTVQNRIWGVGRFSYKPGGAR